MLLFDDGDEGESLLNVATHHYQDETFMELVGSSLYRKYEFLMEYLR